MELVILPYEVVEGFFGFGGGVSSLGGEVTTLVGGEGGCGAPFVAGEVLTMDGVE